jgi:hypothetical protein
MPECPAGEQDGWNRWGQSRGYLPLRFALGFAALFALPGRLGLAALLALPLPAAALAFAAPRAAAAPFRLGFGLGFLVGAGFFGGADGFG